MGFFDDLDKQAAPVPGHEAVDTSSESLAAIIDRIAGGWVWEGVLSRKTKQRTAQDVSSVEQHVRIAFVRERFVVSHNRIETRRNRTLEAVNTGERALDREGLVEMLRDQPLVARRLVIDAGGQIDPDRPDGESVLDAKDR